MRGSWVQVPRRPPVFPDLMPSLSKSGYKLDALTDAERNSLAKRLTAEERRVMLDHGTEPPFCGGLLDNKQAGTYCCRLCGLPLFRSAAKFESGTGWPSFYEPFDRDHIRNIQDSSYGMFAPKFVANAAMAIWDTCSPTDRRPPASATA